MFSVDASLRAVPGYFGGRAEVAARLRENLAAYAMGEVGITKGRMRYSAVAGIRGRF